MYNTLWTVAESGLLMSVLEKLSSFHLTSLTTQYYWCENGLICSWGKTSFKMLGLTFSVELEWGSHIISIAKTASKKIWALIRSMKFLSLEVALYLYKSTIGPCMEYCCHVWAGAPSCYRIIPSFTASLETLAHWLNLASLTLFYRY